MSDSRNLSFDALVKEWAATRPGGNPGEEARDLITFVETRLRRLAHPEGNPKSLPSRDEIANIILPIVNGGTAKGRYRLVLKTADAVLALFRAPSMMPESKWYISERAKEAADKAFGAPSEMGPDAVTAIKDGLDGTPYMYAVHIDRYEAANTLAAVLAYPDSGDWHSQMRTKLAMVARGYEPNKIWRSEPSIHDRRAAANLCPDCKGVDACQFEDGCHFRDRAPSEVKPRSQDDCAHEGCHFDGHPYSGGCLQKIR